MSEQPKCGTCRYAVGRAVAECRAHPPTAAPRQGLEPPKMGTWPRVDLDIGWCGLHDPIPERNEP